MDSLIKDISFWFRALLRRPGLEVGCGISTRSGRDQVATYYPVATAPGTDLHARELSAIAIATLPLGMGATPAIFSLLNAVLSKERHGLVK